MKTDIDLRPAGAEQGAATVDLIAALEGNDRFRRDSFLGGIFHPGWISYREVAPVDSLHVCIRGDRVSAHVDDVSPLKVRSDGRVRYAWPRVVAHNLAMVLTDMARRARGLDGVQRCNLRCEAVAVDDAA